MMDHADLGKIPFSVYNVGMRKNSSLMTGIDIGTNSIRLVDKEKGIIFDEPCAVALDRHNQAVAIGEEAMDLKDLYDPDARVVLPFASEPADFDALDALIEEMLLRHRFIRLFQKPVLVVSYPTALSDEEVASLEDHFLDFGASEVYCEEQLWVAAIGAGLNINHPVGSIVLNIGHSNCDIALFSQGKQVKKESAYINGKYISDLIQMYFKSQLSLQVSSSAVESIKREIGSALTTPIPRSIEVTGLDLGTRAMRKVILDENQIAALIEPAIREWSLWISGFLASLPEHFQRDAALRGIVCCGGMMEFRGLAAALQAKVGCPFFVTDDPAGTVANGLKILMNRMNTI